MRSRAALLAIAVLALTIGVRADERASGPAPQNPEASAPKQSEVTLFNFGDRDAQCLRWSDGCRTCTREGCSNIGIACQPAAPACTEKKSEQPDQPKQ